MRFSGTFASAPQKISDFPLEDYMTRDERVLNLESPELFPPLMLP